MVITIAGAQQGAFRVSLITDTALRDIYIIPEWQGKLRLQNLQIGVAYTMYAIQIRTEYESDVSAVSWNRLTVLMPHSNLMKKFPLQRIRLAFTSRG